MFSGDDVGQQHRTAVQLKRLKVLQQHLSPLTFASEIVVQSPCRAAESYPEIKVAKASAAVALIPDSAVITVGTAAEKPCAPAAPAAT